jgi:hypothetical protein
VYQTLNGKRDAMPIIHSDGSITHTGLVLGHGGSHWNDSMQVTLFYALVWNATKGESEQVCYGSDWDNKSKGQLIVDASPNIMAQYDALTEARRIAYVAYQEQLQYERVTTGKIVDVNRGRKVPKGTRGIVFWVGDNGYGTSIGLLTLDGSKHFTAIGNVDVAGTSVEPVPDTIVKLYQDASSVSRSQWVANRKTETSKPVSTPDYRQRNYRTNYYRAY